jgi:hypothetical protein
MEPTRMGLLMFASTIVVVVALFVVGIVPLWLAAVILVADGALTFFFVTSLERNRAR